MRRIYLAGAALLGLVLAAAPPARSEQAAPSATDYALKIAVVRVGQVTKNMQEGRKMNEALKSRYTEMQREHGNKEAEINQLISSLGQLKPGSPQWTDVRGQIDDKKLSMEVWGKKMELELQRRAKADLKSAYDHIAQAVQTVAEQRHLDLVIADNSPDFLGPDLDAISPQQLEQVLASRAVLFSAKRADITEDVLTLVDANFAKQNQAASTGPQLPPVH